MAPPVAILGTAPSPSSGPPGVKGTLEDAQRSTASSFPDADWDPSLPHPSEKLHCCQRCQPLQEDQQLRGIDGSGGLSPRSG